MQIPTLLIAGALDAKFTAQAQAMAAALPQARAEIVPNAGHNVHLEQPDLYSRLVLDFLVQQDQPLLTNN